VLLEREDRITLLPRRNLLVGAVLEAEVLHAVVVVEPVRLGLDERRPAALASSRHGLHSRLVHGDDVHPVDDHARHPVARRAIDDVRDRHRLVPARELAELVVLAGEHDRQVQRARHVGRLVERADVRRAVAEECHRHVPVTAVLVGERGADRDR
jgi:hypothetical protein